MAFVAALTWYPEIRHHEVEELVGIELRVENVGGGHAFKVQPIEQTVEQRRLARAYFTGEQDEPFAIFDAIGEARQRFLDFPRQEQITRIRVGVERVFSQAEERFIHELVSGARNQPRPVRRAFPSSRLTAGT